MSKQPDPIKKSDRKARQRSKETPALTASDTDNLIPSSDTVLRPESRRDASVDEAPNPYTMALRIEVDHAANGESSETGGSGSSEYALRGTTTEPERGAPDRNATAQSNARVRAEEFAAENARQKADTDIETGFTYDFAFETRTVFYAQLKPAGCVDDICGPNLRALIGNIENRAIHDTLIVIVDDLRLLKCAPPRRDTPLG